MEQTELENPQKNSQELCCIKANEFSSSTTGKNISAVSTFKSYILRETNFGIKLTIF
jgi:hypothetical protein